jgi:hypothetical protein
MQTSDTSIVLVLQSALWPRSRYVPLQASPLLALLRCFPAAPQRRHAGLAESSVLFMCKVERDLSEPQANVLERMARYSLMRNTTIGSNCLECSQECCFACQGNLQQQCALRREQGRRRNARRGSLWRCILLIACYSWPCDFAGDWRGARYKKKEAMPGSPQPQFADAHVCDAGFAVLGAWWQRWWRRSGGGQPTGVRK